MAENIVVGQTSPIDHQLLRDGVALDLTGMTVALQLLDRNGVAVATNGNVSVVTTTLGIVRYIPDSVDFQSTQGSPYSARWVVTVPATSEVAYCPNGEADVWTVRR